MAEWIYGIISVIVTATIIGITKVIDKIKFEELHGSQKILGIVAILTITSEIVYLSVAFGLLEFALETITSIGVGIVLLGVAFQNKLKNAIAGISIAINPRINLGDFIEVENVKGKIFQFGLTKTIIEVDDGTKVIIPNVKFDEEIIRIESNKKRKD
ncbi:MAG: mechanosensitive ion channel family protein [Nitrosopumilus sp.]|nr:mechanosensitive ion channel family protein [Nitrosopumilus sp.]MDH3737260.1 mechanosensitive ion channel family protein [Nitrosopumilus sp.]MDH3822937.1 mechanosensitive ion channel family protein [Nitrosopumilus sp.]MDH3833385.1 mechanosensitive ion channel family protein [Nitrosopumilus sp.]